MLEFNFNEILNTLQSLDYNYIISNMIGPSQLEVLVFTIGMLFYALFVWSFYKKLSKRDLFKLDMKKSIFLSLLKHVIIFPFYVAFWFVILSIFLFIMAKDVSVRNVALISIALMSTVRITSYLKEDLSQDLAKLIPLALLAIFLINPNFFSWDLLVMRLEAMPSLGFELLQFLVFAIGLEWILRILYSVKLLASRNLTYTENQ